MASTMQSVLDRLASATSVARTRVESRMRLDNHGATPTELQQRQAKALATIEAALAELESTLR